MIREFIKGTLVSGAFVSLGLGLSMSLSVRAQDPAAKTAAGEKSLPISAPTPTARKSFKLLPGKDSLAEQAQQLESIVVQAEQALLRYIGNSTIYDSIDTNARLAAFNQQDALFQRLRNAQQIYGAWIQTQRREFNCERCVPIKDSAASQWRFEEPSQAPTQPTPAQGDIKQ